MLMEKIQKILCSNNYVAKVLNDIKNDSIRRGFTEEVFNSRGAYVIDPKGTPEKELANKWAEKAEEAESLGLIKFATELKRLATNYRKDAERIINDRKESLIPLNLPTTDGLDDV